MGRDRLKYKTYIENDRNTSGLQQMYNSLLTWSELYILWGPPHVRGLLYICCKPGVRESVLDIYSTLLLVVVMSYLG